MKLRKAGDPYINHFAQADTVVPGAGSSQAWDRYAYVNNNPVRYNDPTGHMCSDPDAPDRVCERGGVLVPAPGVSDTRETYGPQNQQDEYDGDKAGEWARRNMNKFVPNCKGYSCAEFVSTALLIGGLPCTSGWGPNQLCSVQSQPWNDASALFFYLTQVLNYKAISVDISDPETYFENNSIPAGSPVFYDTGWRHSDPVLADNSFLHVAITTGGQAEGFNPGGNYLDFAGMRGPEVADHNGAMSQFGPHLLYQTQNKVAGIVIVLIGINNEP